jgi:hypothetical protein
MLTALAIAGFVLVVAAGAALGLVVYLESRVLLAQGEPHQVEEILGDRALTCSAPLRPQPQT